MFRGTLKGSTLRLEEESLNLRLEEELKSFMEPGPGVDAGLVGVLNNCLAMSRDILRSDGLINHQPESGLTVADSSSPML